MHRAVIQRLAPTSPGLAPRPHFLTTRHVQAASAAPSTFEPDMAHMDAATTDHAQQGRLDSHDPFPSQFVPPRRVDVWLPPSYFAAPAPQSKDAQQQQQQQQQGLESKDVD